MRDIISPRKSRSRWLPSGTQTCTALHGPKTIATTTPSISTAGDQALQYQTESYYLEPIEYKIQTPDSIIGYLHDLKVVTEESSGITRIIVPFLVKRGNSPVQKKDNCEKSGSIKNLNEKVILVGNQQEKYCLDSACPENRVALVVPTVNHTEQDQILNQSYCTSTTNTAKQNIVQTRTFSKKQRTIGLDLVTKTISADQIPKSKREITGTMEYDLVEELNKPFQEDFNDIDFSAYSILQDLLDDSSPSVDDYSGESSPTPATTTLTSDIELKQEISPTPTNQQMEDLWLGWEEDQLYGETVTQPDPTEVEFRSFSNDLTNEDTINLSDTFLPMGSPMEVLRTDPFLCDSPTQIKPIKDELIPQDTNLSQEDFASMLFNMQETIAQDSNNNNSNNIELKPNKPELLFEEVVLSQESLSNMFNIPETIAHDANKNSSNSSYNSKQKARLEGRKRKLKIEFCDTDVLSKPKKLILPTSRVVAAQEAYPSTPDVIEKALDLQEQFSTYTNSNTSHVINFDLLANINEVSNGPSEDLSSNSSTVFTAPSTPFSYPSTCTTPTPMSQKRRGRPPKTDNSLPNLEEMEHLSEKEKKYYELRGKNNMASRKSRQRRKFKEEKSREELDGLKRENSFLTNEYARRESIEVKLKTIILSRRSH